MFAFLVLSPILAAPVRTNYVPDFADGTGIESDPYTNWTDALASETTVVFTPGWYQLPSAGAGNIPDGATLRCEGATIVWPASRTSEASAFTIPSSADHVVIEGCTFAPGRTVDPVNGHSDGGGAYITVGDFGSQTPISVTIDNNKFGPGVLSTGLVWRTIYIRGAVDRLRISRNHFEFTDRAIDFAPGSDSLPSWTYANVLATENIFSYSEAKGSTEQRWWYYFGSPFGYWNNVALMKNITFSNNVMTGKGAMGLRITRGFDGVVIANNVISAEKFDIIYTFGANDTALVLRGIVKSCV